MSGSSSWNTSGFAFAPNTNTMDPQGMPSERAQAARDKTAEIMAAMKAGDTEKANALMGKDQSGGKIIPGVGWLKKKMNKKNQSKLEGEAVESQEVESQEVLISGKEKEKDDVVR